MKIIAVSQKGMNKIENEDRIVVGKSILAGGALTSYMECGLVAIADGVGGNNAGSVASHFIANKICALTEITEETLRRINAELLALSMEKPEYNGMATTLSGMLFAGASACLFSVGNTRVYFLQGGKYLKQLTKDDTTLSYLLDTGRLTEEDVGSFDRKNEITACFGGGREDLFKIKFNDIESVVSPILLTSDGIHDFLSADQMEDIIEEYGLTETACEEMISKARMLGSCDDASIVLGCLYRSDKAGDDS